MESRESGRTLRPQSDVECISITIVGVLGSPNDGAGGAHLDALTQAVARAISDHYPAFQPAYPPVVVTIVSLPELRIPDDSSASPE